MGSVNLDNTGSGSAITLSSDGTSLLLDGTAVGGGGGDPALYRDNASSATTPIATGANAVAIGTGADALATGAIAIGENSYASSSANRGLSLGRNSYVNGSEATAVGSYCNATGTYANAFGHNATSAGQDSSAIGKSYASGTDSFAAAIADNTATYGAQGNYAQAIGYHAKSTGSRGLSVGPCISSGGFDAYALGAWSEATQRYSWALGVSVKSDIIGKMAYSGAKVNNTTGSSQQGTYVLMKQTTDATQATLTTNNSGTSNTSRNRMFIGANTAYAFTGMVVARETGSTGDLAAAWQVQGLVKTASNESPTLVTKVINVVDNTPSWGFDIAIFYEDTGVAGIDFLATGQASKNIHWVATITTTELINP